MGECGVCADVQGALDLRQDDPEMGDSDDVFIGVKGVQTIHGCVDAPCRRVPAFALWGRNIAGRRPISPAEFGMLLGYIAGMHAIPLAEIHLS